MMMMILKTPASAVDDAVTQTNDWSQTDHKYYDSELVTRCSALPGSLRQTSTQEDRAWVHPVTV